MINMENREIEKQITEILYKNSSDDSSHLMIKFENINHVIKLLVNVSDQQNKHQIECTEHIKEVCDDYEKQNKALLDEIERLRSVLTETINEKFEINDKYISKCGDCVQAWQFSNLMIDENKKLKDEIERLKSELKDKDSVISDLKQAMIRGKDFNNLTFD